MNCPEFLSRLRDANVFVLSVPTRENPELIVATLHPFDLDGRGFEARIYKLVPERVEASPRALSDGWGIEDVVFGPDFVHFSRDDAEEECYLKIFATMPCEIEAKRRFLGDHPDIFAEGPPLELLGLRDSQSFPWDKIVLSSCV